MPKDSSSFCMMPWAHFHVGNEGWVKACCVANIPYGNINKQSLEEVWNGETVKQLRQRFLKGERDNRCAVCYNNEASGCKSIRQETNEKYAHLKDKVELTQEDGTVNHLPVYWDIRFSNVCNFRCRTCWHGASSRWFEDAKALGNTAGKEAVITNIHDFELFLDKMGSSLFGLEELYFAGGEPLVTEEHYQLLELLIAKGLTNVRLRYNTNFSKLSFKNYDVLELWQAFDSVELQISLDGYGELGELIRKEMKWEKILENASKVKAFPHIKTKLAPTVSILNIRHLTVLYLESLKIDLINPEALYLNFLDRPLHYNIKALPANLKQEISEEYRVFLDGDLPESIKDKFRDVLEYMHQDDLSNKWPKFIQETKKLDHMRGEDSFELLPFKVELDEKKMKQQVASR